VRGTEAKRRIITAAILLLLGACADAERAEETTAAPGTPVTSEPGSTTTMSTTLASTTSTLARPETVTDFTDAAPPGSVQVEMTHLTPFRFAPDALTVHADNAVFFLVNTAPDGAEIPIHTFAIGPSLGELIAVSSPLRPGDSASFTVTGPLEGEYVIWCTIMDHAAEGMVGTLTVG
jgi:plastocyanin